MKKLISLLIVILMMFSLVACDPKPQEESAETSEKLTVYLPTVKIVNNHVYFPKEDVPESGEYVSYLGDLAAYIASKDDDINDIDSFIIRINEYKFYVDIVDGKVTRVSYEEVEE